MLVVESKDIKIDGQALGKFYFDRLVLIGKQGKTAT